MSEHTQAGRTRTTIYDQYRKTLLTPAEVKRLSQLRRWPVLRDTAINWGVIALTFAALKHWLSPWTVLAALPVIGTRYYALFIIGHDGLHRRLFRGRAQNDLFNDVFVLSAIGAITRLNNANHIRHHEQLATGTDPDRHKYACLTKPDLPSLLGYLTGATSVFKSIRNVFFGGTKVAAATPSAPMGEVKRYALRDVMILLSVQGLLLGGLSWTFGVWGYPVLWLLPVYVFMFLGDNFRTFAEHSRPESDAKADQHRLVTYLANPLELMFFAPTNMNYHTVHHLWPSIPYYHLPEADRAIRNKLEAEGLEWRRSYLGFLWRYGRSLPLAECRQPAPGSTSKSYVEGASSMS